jgi:predicted phage baseplate assembly protein
MSLPVTPLDIRTFQSLVDEAKGLIPLKCKEWTNHNVSDPGIALIELFAWMTEISLYQLNQVPDVYYTHMLNLMGFKSFPSAAARADLTFTLVTDRAEADVPKGTQVTTVGAAGAPVVFTTLADLHIAQPLLFAALTAHDDAYRDVSREVLEATAAVSCFPQLGLPGDHYFYLGFADSLAGNILRIEIKAEVEGRAIDPDRPPLQWETSSDGQWAPATLLADSTGGLNRNGTFELAIASPHHRATRGSHRAYWLRAKLLGAQPNRPTYEHSPQLRGLSARTVGGSTVAEHSEQVAGEIVGVSNGKPGQVFAVEHHPVLPRARNIETVEIHHDGQVEKWDERDDFVNSGDSSKHFTWDSTTGEIRFGPRLRNHRGHYESRGAVPPAGARVVVTAYRHGGGRSGNLPANSLTAMRAPIPYVASVTNREAATGGVDAETPEEAKERGPLALRAGARAVTVQDFERLTLESHQSIARSRCLPPTRSGEAVRVLLVPAVDVPMDEVDIDSYRIPPETLRDVRDYIDARRVLGTRVEIGTPYYQGVSVAAQLTASPGLSRGNGTADPQRSSAVHERARTTLYEYFNPRTWEFDQGVNIADIAQLLEAVDGVAKVMDVVLFDFDLRRRVRVGTAKDVIHLQPESLFLPARHQVVVR